MSNGRIPQEVIDAVLKHHDIVDVVGKHVHLTKQGHYLKGLCPFHSEKTPSFTVTPEKQIYKCFGCGAGGGVIQFVMEIEGLSYVEAVRELAEEANIPVSWGEISPEQTEQQLERSALHDAHEFAAKLYHHILKNTEQGREALAYLRNRGFSDKVIDEFQIGYAPAWPDKLAQLLESRGYALPLMERGGLLLLRPEGGRYVDRFRDRVIFPIRDGSGKPIGFAGRTLGSAQPKYLNSPESPLFRKSRCLYNLHLARAEIRKLRTAVLFEGYADVIKAWEAGVLNGVATMGTALTEEHALLLKRMADQVIVCYDGDSAGQSAAYKSIPILEKAGCEVRVAIIPNGADPDEYIGRYGSERFRREIIEASVSSMKYKLLYLRKNFRLQEPEGKVRYIHAAVRLIAGIPLPVEREHYLKELSSEFDYSYETIKQEMFQALQELQKMNSRRDNNDIPWNNVMNDSSASERVPSLLPAYHNAERKLLEAMMHDREVAEYVEQHLGDQFNVEAHAALAAYLYSYYASGNEPDIAKYISMLQDEKLESLASEISMTDFYRGLNGRVIDDYIREIKKHPQQLTVERKREEMVRAERSGNVLLAAQIAIEIITLEKQLKAM